MTAWEKLKAWREANPDKVHAQRARYWLKHGKTHSIKVRAWRTANPERVRAATVRWRRLHADRVREYSRRNYKRHASKKINRIIRWQSDQCRMLGDYYIRHKLSRGRFPLSLWPDSLVQLKRAELQIRRFMRTEHHGNTERHQ